MIDYGCDLVTAHTKTIPRGSGWLERIYKIWVRILDQYARRRRLHVHAAKGQSRIKPERIRRAGPSLPFHEYRASSLLRSWQLEEIQEIQAIPFRQVNVF